MGVSRRDFLKLSGGTVLVASLGVNLDPAKAYAKDLRIKNAKVTTTVCPYCSVGCGILVHARTARSSISRATLNTPSTRGRSAPKGASLSDGEQRHPPYQTDVPGARRRRSGRRLSGTGPWTRSPRRSRTPGTGRFKATSKAKVKEKQPDGTEIEVEKEFTVNRTDAIAHVGSAALDNEECYLLQKLLRSWGLVYIEHQARI